MHRRWSYRTLTVCTCLVAGTLAAQEPPRTALVMGLNGPGLQVPISNAVALRADVAVSVSSFGDSHTWTEGLGLSGIFYRSTSNALKTFVGPRIGFTYAGPSGAHTQTFSGSLFFGTEYSLSNRFGVFGEAGLTFSRQSGTRLGQANVAVQLDPIYFTSTFSGVGVLFHF